MAERDPADLTCDNQDDHPVVAFGRWGHRESALTVAWEPWQLYCRPCLDEQRRWRPEFQYVLLDPTRVGRVHPDDHDPPEDDDHDPADVGYWVDGRRP